MTSFETLLAKLAAALEKAGVDYMIIGGQAVIVHGEPRYTKDIDVTLAVSRDQAKRLIPIFKPLGLIPVAPDPLSLAEETNVLPLIIQATAQRADIVFSETPYERGAIERAVSIPVGGRPVRFATAEDLLIHKVVAGRPQDLLDARGIWLKKGKELDTAYIERWLEQFAQVPGLEGVLELWRQASR